MSSVKPKKKQILADGSQQFNQLMSDHDSNQGSAKRGSNKVMPLGNRLETDGSQDVNNVIRNPQSAAPSGVKGLVTQEDDANATSFYDDEFESFEEEFEEEIEEQVLQNLSEQIKEGKLIEKQV